MKGALLVFAVLGLGIGYGTLLGLFICSHVDSAELGLTDLRKDILRSLLVAFLTAAVAAGLISLAKHPNVLLPVPVVWYIATKLCWLEMTMLDAAILAASSVVGVALLLLLAQAVIG